MVGFVEQKSLLEDEKTITLFDTLSYKTLFNMSARFLNYIWFACEF